MTEHTPPTAEAIVNELLRDEQVKVQGFGGDAGANHVWRDGFEAGMTRLLAALLTRQPDPFGAQGAELLP